MSIAQIERRYRAVMDWLYGGDMDVTIRYRTVKAVVTRYVHNCSGVYHDRKGKRRIAPGTLAVVERAWISEFQGFRSCYTCLGCIEASERELA